MQLQNIKPLNRDSFYQSLLVKINHLQDEYIRHPTQQRKKELLYHLEGQKAYLSLTEEEKGLLNQLISKIDGFSVESKKSFILKKMNQLERVSGKKVTVQVGNTRKKVAESVQMPYFHCLSFLKSLEIKKDKNLLERKTLAKKEDSVAKKPKRWIPKIIVSLTSAALAIIMAATSGGFHIKLEKSKGPVGYTLKNECKVTPTKKKASNHKKGSSYPKDILASSVYSLLSATILETAQEVQGPIKSNILSQSSNNQCMQSSEELEKSTIYSEPFFPQSSYSFENIAGFSTIATEKLSNLPGEVFQLSDNYNFRQLSEEIYKEESLDLASYPPLNCDNEHVYYRIGKPYKSDQVEFELTCRVVYGEGGGDYREALNVVTTMLNRVDTSSYIERFGPTISNQIWGPLQFTAVDLLPDKPFEKVPEEVKQAVTDCFNGLRSHEFLQFRSKHNPAPDRVQIVDGGNYYFSPMTSVNEIEEDQLILLDETSYQLTK